jgi:biotin-dependent carboxylase-like uncharacterized protein
MLVVRVESPGLLSTVQDAGRYGYAHLGISPGGAADPLAMRIANRVVGNDENAAVLEMTLLGATVEFEESCVVALAGADCDCRIGNETAPMWRAFAVQAGAILACGPMTRGTRTYLAVQGGFDVPEVLASASTNLSAHFGGHEGRSLRKGDVLRIGKARSREMQKWEANAKAQLYADWPLRVTRSTQQEWFDGNTFERFLTSTYLTSEDSNRSGLRLKGAILKPQRESELMTEGVSLGAVQVPPNGQPIILFVDQQTTGGYPKIANVIAADMHRVGQLRPRDEVRFMEVTISEAVMLLREQEEWLARSFSPSEER